MKHCLAVDDDEVNLDILDKLIAPLGITMHRYVSALKALDACRNFRPDFVLLDYHMQEINGLGFLQELRKLDTGAEIPVIMCTAENKEQHFNTLLAQGIQGYLLKPFTEAEFLKQLEALNIWSPPPPPAEPIPLSF